MIDQKRLKELVEDFGEEDLAELIESFLEEAAGSVAALEGEISGEYSKDRSELFHFIKGCALNVGATDLAEKCGAYETRGAGFTAEEYQALRSNFDAVQAYFQNGNALGKVA